jgi:glycogen operon protein
MRNMLATLFLSQGVPMLLAGDELAKTQNGNNNCYCQDNETSWLQWDMNDEQTQMLDFVRGMIALRKAEPVFRRQKYFQGRSIRGDGSDASDVSWIGTDGKEVADEVWNAGFIKCLGLRLDGKLIGEVDEHGEPIEGDTVLLLLNSHHEKLPFMLPTPAAEAFWEPLMDTAQFPGHLSDTKGGTEYELQGRCMALLRLATPAKVEQKKQGFVAAEIMADTANQGTTNREPIAEAATTA